MSSVNRVFLVVAASIVISVALVRLLFEMFQLINLKIYYVLDWVNWIEVLLFIFAIIFVFVYFTECFCPTNWQWQLGCIAVFLTWINLIIFIRKIPLTGWPPGKVIRLQLQAMPCLFICICRDLCAHVSAHILHFLQDDYTYAVAHYCLLYCFLYGIF